MKRLVILSLIFLFTFGMGLMILPMVSASADYAVNVNDVVGIEWIQDDIYSNPIGKQLKIEVIAINTSDAGGMWANTTWVKEWYRLSSANSWTLLLQGNVSSVYNQSTSNYLMVGGYGGFGIGSGLLSTVQQSGFLVASSNLTAVHKYFNKSWLTDTSAYKFNNSKLTGLNLTMWNGTNEGIGGYNGAYKMEIIFNATTNVTSSCKIYTWSTSSAQWVKKLETKAIFDFSTGTQTGSPPIPGFELIFIIITLASIMGLFLWRRMDQKNFVAN